MQLSLHAPCQRNLFAGALFSRHPRMSALALPAHLLAVTSVHGAIQDLLVLPCSLPRSVLVMLSSCLSPPCSPCASEIRVPRRSPGLCPCRMLCTLGHTLVCPHVSPLPPHRGSIPFLYLPSLHPQLSVPSFPSRTHALISLQPSPQPTRSLLPAFLGSFPLLPALLHARMRKVRAQDLPPFHLEHIPRGRQAGNGAGAHSGWLKAAHVKRIISKAWPSSAAAKGEPALNQRPSLLLLLPNFRPACQKHAASGALQRKGHQISL